MFIAFVFSVFLSTVVFGDDSDSYDITNAEGINVDGIGASLPYIFYKEAILRYQVNNTDQSAKNMRLTYVSRNGYIGKCHLKQLRGCETQYLYAGSNSEPTELEQKIYPNLRTFPVLAGAVVLIYNIPGIQLTLTLDQIVDIYSGKLKNWNDPALSDNNPKLMKHAQPILQIARRDVSDTTHILTTLLSRTNENWRKNFGIFKTGLMTEVRGMGDEIAGQKGWPNDTVFMYAKGTAGMMGIVASIPYSLGYIAITDAIDNNLPIVELYNSKNKLIRKHKIMDGVREAMRYFTEKEGPRLATSITNAPTENAYPMATYSYMIVNGTTAPYISCKQMVQYFRYMLWFLKDAVPREIARANSMVNLGPELIEMVEKEVLKTLTCKGRVVWEIMEEDIYREKSELRRRRNMIIIQASVISLLFIIVVIGCAILQHYRMTKAVNAKTWLWKEEDFKIFTKSKVSIGSRNTLEEAADMDLMNMSKRQKLAKAHDQSYVLFSATFRKVPEQFSARTTKKVHEMISNINDDGVMKLAGITTIGGGFNFYFVYNGQDVQWLHYIFRASRYEMNDQVRLAIAIDTANAMEFLHAKDIVHTTLNSMSVFVDAKWTVKVGDWAKKEVYESEGGKATWCGQLAAQIDLFMEELKGDSSEIRLILQYIDPSVYNFVNMGDLACQSMDSYSFGMLLMEMWTRHEPLHEKNTGMRTEEAIKSVLHGKSRPEVPEGIDPVIKDLIKWCIQPNGEARPSFPVIGASLKKNKPNTSESIVVTLMKSMEEYMANLEISVEERNVEMQATKDRMDKLLSSMLPPEIAKKLKNNETINPEYFKSASIYFSDIVVHRLSEETLMPYYVSLWNLVSNSTVLSDVLHQFKRAMDSMCAVTVWICDSLLGLSKDASFTDISSDSSPLQVVNLLNKLYILFDECVEKYAVYKLETIGDAYMCVSGVPTQNGNLHCAEITRMAIAILVALRGFKIPHLPDRPLRIRVGLNTGSVMAGVVGVKMPRYCLFGDTVHFAQRMEATSSPMRIHGSKTTVALLRVCFPGEFAFTKRGKLEVKDKGEIETFWIHKPNTNIDLMPIQPDEIDDF